MSIEAMTQALEADRLIRGYVNSLVSNKPDEAAGFTKRMVDYVFATPPAQPAPVQEPMDREAYMAIREARENASEDAYFAARPEHDKDLNRVMFRCGFYRGYAHTPPAARRQWVGLTDEEYKVLVDARNEAMLWAIKGRIPECGAFAGIAQNLDYLCEQLSIEAAHGIKEKNT